MGLQPFEGREVIGTSVAVRNAGDGLSKALAVDPEELHLGETVFLVLECEVTKVQFDPVKDSDDLLVRVHVLKAGDATLVAGDVVADHLESQRVRIEEARGVHRLQLDGEEDPSDG